MQLNGHGQQKYINSDLLGSSVRLGWSSILVERWIHGAGQLQPLRPLETEIAVQLAGNSRVKRHGDGRVQDNHSMPGTIWLCPAGIYERSVRIFAQINECLHIYIPRQLFSQAALEEFGVDPDKAELRYEGGFSDNFIEQIALSIRAEMKDASSISPLLVETMRVVLAAHLLKNYSNLSPSACHLPDHTRGLDPKRMHRLVEFIDENLHRNISLSEMAAEACFSPFHFARVFKKSTGQSPGQFVKHRKIEVAKKLLHDRDRSLADVATSTGFSSQSHFSRSFSKALGVPPGAYRKENV